MLFIGAENLRPDVAAMSGVLLEQTPFFAVRTMLVGKDRPSEITTGTHRYPFAIQLPMVNYPPSFEHHLCKCSFRLVVVLQVENQPRRYCERQIRYIPYIETSPLKSHHTVSSQKCTITLPSLSYVPSDNIPISYDSSQHALLAISIKLCRRLSYGIAGTINHMDEFVYQTDTKFHEPVFSGITYFTLPENLTPSIDYSDFMSMSYTLEISVKRNKLLGTAVHLKVPITIGTMGPGIRTPTELKTYRMAKPGTPSTRNTTPAFVPRIEYEDCLPEYDDCRLPTYQAV
ncbi:hypothetical protein VKS41_007768 [Umbelopsis sp. WA50703]